MAEVFCRQFIVYLLSFNNVVSLCLNLVVCKAKSSLWFAPVLNMKFIIIVFFKGFFGLLIEFSVKDCYVGQI